ncbi:MAG: hypothetical protein HUU09_10610 [Candidatus Jettenia caeni]|nr:hypothetical protein [Candidatus Jettenia caeni]
MKNISLKTLAQNVLKKLNTAETEKKETETLRKPTRNSQGNNSKIEPARETQQMEYRPTEADFELERYIGRPSTNLNGNKCITCGAIGERYCLGQDSFGKWWWGWRCLRCRPYIEPERN